MTQVQAVKAKINKWKISAWQGKQQDGKSMKLGKIFLNNVSDKWLISKIHKQLI